MIAATAGEHDVGGLVKRGAIPSIATLRDAAVSSISLDFQRLGTSPDKGYVTRRGEVIWSVDGGDDGERRQLADPGVWSSNTGRPQTSTPDALYRS
jgi:hypothetical protein